MNIITKLIIPAAGLGTRFLPITKSIPKEMLPLNNKPALEYIIQEGLDAGINKVNIIISPQKTSIIDYFSYNPKLADMLKEQSKEHLLQELNHIIDQIDFQYSIQAQPLGVADALLKIENYINTQEFFAMAYPDDIILGQTSELQNLIQIAQEHKALVFGVIQVPQEKIASYGVVKLGKQINQNLFEITDFIEKPKPEQAPSNFAIIGRFILHHDIFTHLKRLPSKNNQEIIWFDAIKNMIQQGHKVLGFVIQGERFDIGIPQGWIDCINQLQKKS